ncbi:MAG: hypothetical protein ABIN48_08415 [Ginsengibacter sp.]
MGLIEIAVGGSPLISWTDRPSIESDPLLVNSFRCEKSNTREDTNHGGGNYLGDESAKAAFEKKVK